ncbi:ROK family protein [Rhizobium sp. TH2]|uniref:ROK family protein n=1 Tax=Rhizobium sp. TH2 TaxID=2775403 RepID=UPI00215750CD|nr:ROK family protein [Rhizobium sp. TH2]UVC08587.1 ROK family protein [Rhizobium sp. TH2]
MTGGNTAIGVDVGGTNIRVARVSANGRILQKVLGRSDTDPAAALTRIVEMIREVDAPDVAAIGIGIPGRVDYRQRLVLSGGYLDLSGVETAKWIEDQTGKPVVIDNDCSMALVAEAAVGAAKGHRNIVMLTIGTGIGGAIMENDEIVRGARSAGQLGHITVDFNGRPCACGRRGCVETESSGTALGRHMEEAGYPAGTRADALLGFCRAGDDKALGVIRRWARPLRAAIDTISATLDPEIVLLGGGLGVEAREALNFVPGQSSWFKTEVRAASLCDDAGMIGSALAALGGVRTTQGNSKSVLMVNGIPASGKSRMAHEISARTGWPVLSLDTIKNPFLEHLGGADRLFNRTLGKASYQSIWSIVRDAPEGSAFIIDAWFGFQPMELLRDHIAMSGVGQIAEIWCHAPGEVLAERYAARLDERPAGHPGASYIPELIELASRAEPTGLAPLYRSDTTMPASYDAIAAWARSELGKGG